jgi:hypothetical protein
MLRDFRSRRSDGEFTTADLQDSSKTIWGWIDFVTADAITGWAVSADPGQTHLLIELRDGSQILGAAYTEVQRRDIAQILGRPVAAGFRIDLGRVARALGAGVKDLLDRPLTVYIPSSNIAVGPSLITLDGPIIERLQTLQEGQLEAIRKKRELAEARIADRPEGGVASVKAIAFYLPQFHRTEANDEWWGDGFTEWSNVAQARSFFTGHTQPRMPTDLGFYDVEAPETLRRQAHLAKKFGVHGFCFYSYSFEGEPLLQKPVQLLLQNAEIELPFCLCWANENWTRRWDGAESEVLISQTHDGVGDRSYIGHVLAIMKDPRYIRVDDAPVLLVYRPSLLADPAQTTEAWRAAARREGFKDLHLVMAQTFGAQDPRPLGFDAAVEFPPHGFPAEEITDQIEDLHPAFRGRVYDYRSVVASALTRPASPYKVYRTAMPSWDNSPRKDTEGHIYAGSTPALFQAWLAHNVDLAGAELGTPIVFINAWNEWAEGAHLEPDSVHGKEYLQAVRSAVAGLTSIEGVMAAMPERLSDGGEHLVARWPDVVRSFQALEQANRTLAQLQTPRENAFAVSRFRHGVPMLLAGLPPKPHEVRFWIDRLGPYTELTAAVIQRGSVVHLSGWSMLPGSEQRHDSLSLLCLTSTSDSTTYSAFIFNRHDRPDVAEALAPGGDDAYVRAAGFSQDLDFRDVAPGSYTLRLLYPRDTGAHTGEVHGSIHVV